MSKAFTKETDTEDELPDEPQVLAEGVKNYVTPRGFRRLQDELRQLVRVERPKVVEVVSWAAGNGDRSENGDYIYGKKRLREIDRRARYLTKRLESAVLVVSERQKNRDQVFFGATVTYANARGAEHTITIVGVDEAEGRGLDLHAVREWSRRTEDLQQRRRGGAGPRLVTAGGRRDLACHPT